MNKAELIKALAELLAEKMELGEEPTNGEVIQAVFGVMVLTVKDGKVWVERIFFPFDEDWWNAPYQKGDE